MATKWLLTELINKLSFAVCIVRSDLNIVSVNDCFLEYSGLNRKQLIGRPLPPFFRQSETQLEESIHSVINGIPSLYLTYEEIPLLFPVTAKSDTKVPESLPVDVEIAKLNHARGEPGLICLCFYDRSANKTQKNTIQELTGQLEQTQQKLQKTREQVLQAEKMASIGQLTAGIAHEINSPMGFIASNIQSLDSYYLKIGEAITELDSIIEATDDPFLISQKSNILDKSQILFVLDDVKALVNETLDGSNRIMSIINNLKDYSHSDHTQWSYSDITQGMDDTLKIVNNQIKYNINLVKNYESDTPKVYCQMMKISQVFMNLLVNASQAVGEQGHIEISIAPLDTEQVQIKISDDGCGIDEKNIAHIFEPFFTTKPQGAGTGLGLSVSDEIVRAHHGKIEVESEPDKGTTFTLTLPVNQVVS
ncbi:ATP-binding protein [Vibrio sp. JC009]|uniref:ATP-binding protein n=1 Tax=Vibrio sp. JC009 TaxID=2912314 RepID=UPI0023B1DB86|nr:ATP-binding protein [Vibrio sp. JC009]WED20774.1 ATP-binding protein [Vibrio sp. JC009]